MSCAFNHVTADQFALKESIKLGNKGVKKHITKKVLQYLQDYFLAGNLKAIDCYSLENMHTDFENLAKHSKLLFEKIPIVKTIKNWIRKYSASFIIESNNNKHILIYNKSNKHQKFS
ncbi:22439_t:CDS:2 [Gigaspora margarita]|uniref:22439_t:CDS:1 n=1 Tax=Gigaspora margarita TaxID=4874 RepID=A0ABM8VXX3_GIGMA|nr:22439_t:CDS:2 [Gigaspora margarita]